MQKHLQINKKLILNTADVKEKHITKTEILKNHFITAKHLKKCSSISIYAQSVSCWLTYTMGVITYLIVLNLQIHPINRCTYCLPF